MIRRAGAAAAVLAAVAVLVATWRHLQVGLLLDGIGQGYRLPQLAIGAASGAAVALCAVAARRRRGLVLLVGPVLLTVLAAQASSPTTTFTYGGSYVPLLGVTSTQAYESELALAFDTSPWLDAVLLLLALLVGAGVVAGLTRRAGTPPPDPAPRP